MRRSLIALLVGACLLAVPPAASAAAGPAGVPAAFLAAASSGDPAVRQPCRLLTRDLRERYAASHLLFEDGLPRPWSTDDVQGRCDQSAPAGAGGDRSPAAQPCHLDRGDRSFAAPGRADARRLRARR